MSRSKNSKNDWLRYRKFEQENEKLRKEVGKLRKMISKMVIDQLEEKERRANAGEATVVPNCSVCGNEDLHIIPIQREDGRFEIRVCRSCNHRSQMIKKKELKKQL